MKTALAIIVVIIVIGGGYLLFAKKTQAPTTAPETATTTVNTQATNPAAAGAATQTTAGTQTGTAAKPGTVPASVLKTITYNGSTFSPATVTIKQGDTVKFVDTASAPMWVASNPHPTHTAYSGTSALQHCPDTTGTAFDQCAPGSSYTFTFLQIGSWGYHNHLNHGSTGTVIVTK